ncbi:hypothetical protein [Bremerella sp. P1]|uniref:hypothetical protein n=1 Tax=Bremerella sp. P1 TaxID=3026424 RepID=UPI002368A81F|nr:hypothetical protein [Bremerella sp. P1]WDI44763.1 hypothetical protein PSR63_12535 [Bremerella sp. P1]
MKSKWPVIGLLIALLLGISIGHEPAPAVENNMAFVDEIHSVELPEGRRWYTVLVTQGETHIDEWFESDTRLKKLKDSTEWRHYESKSPVFKSHLMSSYGNDYPILVVQDVDGAMRAQLGGTQLKAIVDPDQLVQALDYACDTLRPKARYMAWRPWSRPCPGPYCPAPQPEPQPKPQPLVVTPDEKPVVETPWLDWLIGKAATGAATSFLSGNPYIGGGLAAAAGVLLLLKRRKKRK